MNRVCIAIVGLGGWGRNHLRTFANLQDCRIKYIYDLSPQAIEAQLSAWPALRAAISLEEILVDPEVRAVVIATSARSHYEIARQALLAGKDVFIEKPMTLEVAESEELCRMAEERGLLIQVGHLMIFHPAVRYLKEIIDRGDLGDLYYIYCQRLNLGVVRSDENALWSLAPHDLSMANFIFGDEPVALKAVGGTYLQKKIEDVIFMTLTYPDGRLAHVHVSWLDPRKVRQLTIVGSKKMAVFDDMEAAEKVRIYDKGVSRMEYENFGELLSIRTGDIHIPSIPNAEPLKLQAQHFLECIRSRRRPLACGADGLAVVRMLSAAGRELNG